MIEEHGDTPMAALLEIMRRLRDPETGCPWDAEQTFETIAPFTIEEAYEVADAIERGSREELKGELGDLLLQVVYYAQMGREEGAFTFDDIARGVAEKMIRRHPHVFGDQTVADAAAQTVNWEAAKAAERAAEPDNSILGGVALALPALMRAQKLQKRAMRAGFDWPEIGGVIDKIAEEAREVTEARESGDAQHLAEEYGDLLFTVGILGQWLGVDAEQALKAANKKFERRFRAMEARLAADGKAMPGASLEEMEEAWQATKAAEA